GDRRLVHRPRPDGHAAGVRDAVLGLRLVRLRPPWRGRPQAALTGRDAGGERRPPPVGRRLLGRPVPLAEPGGLLRALPGPEARLPGPPGRPEGAPDPA